MIKWVENVYGAKVDYGTAVAMMDEEIMENLNSNIAPCTYQEYFDAYCKAHLEKYGEEFELAKENPCY